MSALDQSTDPSVVLRTWIDHINQETQLGLEISEDHLCAIESQNGAIIMVNALDQSGFVLLSAAIATLPDNSEAQLAFLKAIALGNFRDLVSGPTKWSLHPNGKDVFLELPILAPEQLSADDFAAKLFAFMNQHQILKEKVDNGTFQTWADSNFAAFGSSDQAAPEMNANFIRI